MARSDHPSFVSLLSELRQKNERAEYGEGLVKLLSQQLCKEYGTGFDFPNLTRMIRLAKLYPAEEIIVTVSQQLTWSHFVKLMTIEDPLKRDFYIEMCRLERWNVRNLRKKIDSMLYERTANWLRAKGQFLMGIVHFFSAFFKAKKRDFLIASSLGKTPLFLIILRIWRLIASTIFVV